MFNLKKCLVIVSCVFFLASVCIFVSTLAGAADSPVQQAQGESYLVRQTGGQIGVYSLPENGEPMYVLPVAVNQLPETDRILLEAGIYAASYAELVSILEDYGS